MTLIILITLALAAGQLARLYLFPFRRCRGCGGTGRKHSRLNRRNFALCPYCQGNGRVLRPGARLVHRAVLGARSPQARARLRTRDTGVADDAPTPARQFPPAERSTR
jgi:hypothetical protein